MRQMISTVHNNFMRSLLGTLKSANQLNESHHLSNNSPFWELIHGWMSEFVLSGWTREINLAGAFFPWMPSVSLAFIEKRSNTLGQFTFPPVAAVQHKTNNNNNIKLLSLSEPNKNGYWGAFPLPRWPLLLRCAAVGGNMIGTSQKDQNYQGTHISNIL